MCAHFTRLRPYTRNGAAHSTSIWKPTSNEDERALNAVFGSQHMLQCLKKSDQSGAGSSIPTNSQPPPVVDRQAFGARGLREWIRKRRFGKRWRQKKAREATAKSAARKAASPHHHHQALSRPQRTPLHMYLQCPRVREERLDKVAHLTRLLKIEHHMYISRVVSHFTDGRQRKKINRPISLFLSLSPLLHSQLASNDTRAVAATRAWPLPCIPTINTPCNVGHPRQAFLSTNQPGRPRRRNRQKKSSSTQSAPL